MSVGQKFWHPSQEHTNLGKALSLQFYVLWVCSIKHGFLMTVLHKRRFFKAILSMMLCCAHKSVFLRCFKQLFILLLACSLIAVNAWGQESTRILSGNLQEGVRPISIRYPLLDLHNIYRTQGVYAFELLHLLCEKSGQPYILKKFRSGLFLGNVLCCTYRMKKST